MKRLFPVMLFTISGIVAIGLFYQVNMWKWIVLYWTVLTIKNGYDIWRE